MDAAFYNLNPASHNTTNKSVVALKDGTQALSMKTYRADGFQTDDKIIGKDINYGHLKPPATTEQLIETEKKLKATGTVPIVQIIPEHQSIVKHETSSAASRDRPTMKSDMRELIA